MLPTGQIMGLRLGVDRHLLHRQDQLRRTLRTVLSRLTKEDFIPEPQEQKLQSIESVSFHERASQILQRMQMRFPEYITPEIRATMEQVRT